MRLRSIVILSIFLCAPLVAQSVWYEMLPGPANRTRWTADSSVWNWTGAGITATTRSYDQLAAADLFIPTGQPWTITTELRGRRAGVFISLDTRDTKATSQMIRFDDRTLLVGWFNGGGEFSATSTFDSPADPAEWVTLRVDVDPKRREMTVWVNGTLAGRDTSLKFTSGYFGLQASDGTSEFRSLRITSQKFLVAPKVPAVGSVVPLSHLARLETHGATLCAFQPEFNSWFTLDPDGRLLRVHEDATPSPAPIVASIGPRTARIVGTSVVFANKRTARTDTSRDRFGAPMSTIASKDRFLVCDPVVNGVLVFSASGEYERTLSAQSIGGFISPRGMTELSNRRVAIADYDRIVILDPTADEPSLMVSRSPDRVRVRRSDGAALKKIVRLDGSFMTSITSDGSAEIRNARPASIVRFRYAPALTTIPPAAGISRPTAVDIPPSDPTQTMVRRLPLMYLVYRTISYRDRYPSATYPHVPAGRTLSDAEIDSLRSAVTFNREFYFRNSACRLVLDVDLSVVADTLWLNNVGDRDPYWLEPRARVGADFAKAAASFGHAPTDYSGLICTYAWVNYPSRRTSALRDPSVSAQDTIRIRQAVGGGTYGVPAPWTYGSTTGYTANPFQDRFSRQDWLITHEFHHQLDALMERSGFPEYAHADLPWKMPGRFGEDFDFNARIMRRAPASSWLQLNSGTLASVTDADHDGVPDDDPTLPFDERRLGSSPLLKDSDRDGLSDLQEVMAGTSHASSPVTADTDGDGLKDGADPYPLIPFAPVIPQIPSASSPLPVFGRATLGGIPTTLSMGWVPGMLIVEVRTLRPANILFQIDAHADGWFHGADNIQLRIANLRDSTTVADYYLRDCASWVNSPKDRRGILRAQELRLTALRARIADLPALSESVVRFQIPAHPELGWIWTRPAALSFRFGIQQQDDLWVWDELFERNFMMTVTLR